MPSRAKAAGRSLAGKVINEQSAREVAHLTAEGATLLAQNGYKLPVF